MQLTNPINNTNEASSNYKPGGNTLLPPGPTHLKVLPTAKKTQNSDGDGEQFEIEFQANNGITFKKWFCHTRYNPEKKWQADQGNGLLACIAQAVGEHNLMSLTQLFGKWFEADIILKDSNKLKDDGSKFQNNDFKIVRSIQANNSTPSKSAESSPW